MSKASASNCISPTRCTSIPTKGLCNLEKQMFWSLPVRSPMTSTNTSSSLRYFFPRHVEENFWLPHLLTTRSFWIGPLPPCFETSMGNTKRSPWSFVLTKRPVPTRRKQFPILRCFVVRHPLIGHWQAQLLEKRYP